MRTLQKIYCAGVHFIDHLKHESDKIESPVCSGSAGNIEFTDWCLVYIFRLSRNPLKKTFEQSPKFFSRRFSCIEIFSIGNAPKPACDSFDPPLFFVLIPATWRNYRTEC